MVGEEGIEPVRALPRWSYSPLPHLEASLPYFGRTYGFRTRFSALKGRRPSPRSPMSHSLVVPDRLELSLRAYETQVRTVRCHQ